MSVIVFPGQGAQHKGMGAELFKRFPELVGKANSILGYSIEELCLHDPEKKLNLTQYTQPALFIVNALQHLHLVAQSRDLKVKYYAGHSLGEFNALLAAEAFDFETGLKLVIRRGMLMSRALGGSMLAVVKTSEEDLKQLISQYDLTGVDIANYNSTSQFVISGAAVEIQKAKESFDKENIFSVPLKVSGAFHSRLMVEIAQEFSGFIDNFDFAPLTTPVIANVSARPYQQNLIRELLVKQVSSSVKWSESIRYLLANNQSEFIEIGSSKVLTKLIADISEHALPLELAKHGADNSDHIEILYKGLPSNQKTQPQVVNDSHNSNSCVLGSKEFQQDYQVKYSYIAGSMCNAISSTDLVVKMSQSGFLAYFGSSGLTVSQVEQAVLDIKKRLPGSNSFGFNVVSNSQGKATTQQLIELFLQHKICNIELAGFTQISADIVKFRVKGLGLNADGTLTRNNKILLKTSNPEVAKMYMLPAPKFILDRLLDEQSITQQQYDLASKVAIADDICVEGDSGWRTNQSSSIVNLPVILRIRNELNVAANLVHVTRVGSAGGVGSPEAIAALFMIGADFVLTGSINQCTVEANTSEQVKNTLETLQPQDTVCTPSGDSFSSAEKVQVVKRGLFFAARSQKLYDLFRVFSSVNDIDESTKSQIEEHFLGNTIDLIFIDIFNSATSEQKMRMSRDPKFKMEQLFKWYFENAFRTAQLGSEDQHSNYQIFSGPALGAFNLWVKGSDLEKWRARNVDVIALRLMNSAAYFLDQIKQKRA